MPRNVVICCDGTNNLFGKENTNVVRLVRSLGRDATPQMIYYDPGVGTFPDPMPWNLASWIKAKTWRLADLMIGWGLEENVTEAYRYLMEYWQPGDRVFLFGFSRGAYTARVLAGLLHVIGLLPRGSHNLVPYAMDLYRSIRRNPAGTGEYWRLCDEFRETFARDSSAQRRFSVHFLGVWDTVSSYGWFWNPMSFPYTAENPSVSIVRHAVSIDERRAFFRQNLFRIADGQDLKELWFPGVHSDVGGGYPAGDGGLWRPAFEWMIAEARRHGLAVDEGQLAGELRNSPRKPWLETIHNSLTPAWWFAEFIPKFQSNRRPRFNFFRPRGVPQNACLERSALLRLREDPNYRPDNLPSALVQEIQQLNDVPESLQYRRGMGA